MAASDRAKVSTLAWHGFRGVKKGLSGALPEGGVNRQSFTHSCRVAMLRAARPVTRFGFSVVADWRLLCLSHLPPKQSSGDIWDTAHKRASFRTFLMEEVPTFGLGFLAPADNCFDQIRLSGAGVAHCRWYLLLRGSLIVDWLCLDFLLWGSSLAFRFSWFTLLGYIGTHQHWRYRAVAASRTFRSVG